MYTHMVSIDMQRVLVTFLQRIEQMKVSMQAWVISLAQFQDVPEPKESSTESTVKQQTSGALPSGKHTQSYWTWP